MELALSLGIIKNKTKILMERISRKKPSERSKLREN
jgi:hypothetical protein